MTEAIFVVENEVFESLIYDLVCGYRGYHIAIYGRTAIVIKSQDLLSALEVGYGYFGADKSVMIRRIIRPEDEPVRLIPSIFRAQSIEKR